MASKLNHVSKRNGATAVLSQMICLELHSYDQSLLDVAWCDILFYNAWPNFKNRLRTYKIFSMTGRSLKKYEYDSSIKRRKYIYGCKVVSKLPCEV